MVRGNVPYSRPDRSRGGSPPRRRTYRQILTSANAIPVGPRLPTVVREPTESRSIELPIRVAPRLPTVIHEPTESRSIELPIRPAPPTVIREPTESRSIELPIRPAPPCFRYVPTDTGIVTVPHRFRDGRYEPTESGVALPIRTQPQAVAQTSEQIAETVFTIPIRSRPQATAGPAVTAMEVATLLDETEKEQLEEQRRENRRQEPRDSDRGRNGRSDRSDRGGRDRRDGRDGRDSRRRSIPRYNRESNGERRESRERSRRDDSRPRSSKSKEADTDEDWDRSFVRRDNSRDRYRGGRRGDRAGPGGGDFYNGRSGRSRSPRRSGREDRREDRYREDRRPAPRHRTRTPEVVTEDDRDKRTVFVQQISQRAQTRHLRQFFENGAGPVLEAQIVTDRVTGRSKGVGYVEFKSEDSVAKALELTGQKLKGVPIIAQLTEAEKNRASRTQGEGGLVSANNGAPFHRLYVGNIHFSVTEDDLREIFAPFGELEQVTLQRDEQNPTRSKGYGFVQFVVPADAKNALSEMNGFELAGRQIRVGLGNDKFTPESTAHLLRNFPQQVASYQGSAFSGAGGRGAYAGGSGGVFDRAHGRDDRGISGASALDDTDMSGVNFKQVDRNKLMMNLARSEVDVPKQAVPQMSRSRAPVSNLAPSRYIKIQNIFDAEEEFAASGPNWAKSLEAEVKGECDKKYGKVVHIAVDATSTEGDIYVKFDSVSGGEKALQGLNGRVFAGRTIRASYVVEQIYNSLYGAAADF